MQRRIRITWHHGTSLLVLFSLALFASTSLAHGVHEHEVAHSPAQETAVDDETPRRLLQAFRVSGDDALLERAWSVIEPQLRSNDLTARQLVDAALIAQARHQFDTALELTRSALQNDRNDEQSWLLLASIHLVKGDSEAAGNACDELDRSHWLLIVGCKARVAHASGDAAKVRPSFDRLLTATQEQGIEADMLAWAFSVAGDLAVSDNDADRAVDYFARSLSLAESTQVRSALVDVLLANDRLADAQAELEKGSRALPLDIRRLILANRQGRTVDVTDRIAAVDRRFREWIAAKDWLHAREMARFYIDVLERPELARQLAEINIGIQKEREDLLLLRRTT